MRGMDSEMGLSKRTARLCALGLSILAISGCGSLALQSAIYPAAMYSFVETDRTTAPRVHGFERRQLMRSDGAQREYFWKAGTADNLTIIFLHGNGEYAQDALVYLSPLVQTGATLAALEYTGFGPNDGTPTRRQLKKDVEAMIATAKASDPDGKIVLVGWSLGGANAVLGAVDDAVDGVVSLSAFTQAADLAPNWARPIVNFQHSYNAENAAKSVHKPWAIVHCKGDPVIPSHMAQALYHSALKGGADPDDLTLNIAACTTHSVPIKYWNKALKHVLQRI